VENNLWGYSTPSNLQFCVKDLAERAIAYGIPGVIVDGTDPCQVYDATHEACERARRGDGPTLIEAKMMRMKGHAIHDAAHYVPARLFEYWHARDPIARFENYLVTVKGWLTAEENHKLIAEVERELEAERDAAVASPMPDPATDKMHQGVYCDASCHEIKPLYGPIKAAARTAASARPKSGEAAVHLKLMSPFTFYLPSIISLSSEGNSFRKGSLFRHEDFLHVRPHAGAGCCGAGRFSVQEKRAGF